MDLIFVEGGDPEPPARQLTLERIELPDYLVGEVAGKSSLGRLGLVIHVTAGFIDPGFCGNITLEILNVGAAPLLLHAGQRICQVKISRLETPCLRAYGVARGSHYVGKRAQGAVPAYVGAAVPAQIGEALPIDP